MKRNNWKRKLILVVMTLLVLLLIGFEIFVARLDRRFGWRSSTLAISDQLTDYGDVKREGVRLYVFDKDGRKLLFALQGLISKVNVKERTLVVTYGVGSEEIAATDIARINVIGGGKMIVPSKVNKDDFATIGAMIGSKILFVPRKQGGNLIITAQQ